MLEEEVVVPRFGSDCECQVVALAMPFFVISCTSSFSPLTRWSSRVERKSSPAPGLACPFTPPTVLVAIAPLPLIVCSSTAEAATLLVALEPRALALEPSSFAVIDVGCAREREVMV